MAPDNDEFKDLNNPEENINPGSEQDLTAGAFGADSINAEAFDPETIGANQTDSTVTVQPVQFASFEDLDQIQGPQNQNLNILLDVKLQLTVELGRTELPIKKVLELTKGSIVTLNKAAGEPVELFANGKLIAYGEVVVIEDNFGLRITHITDPAKRLHSLGSNSSSESKS